MAWARRRASGLSTLSRWKAMRWADLGPTPGSRPSSSIRSWTGAAYTSRTEDPAETAEVEVAHGAGLGLLGLGHGVVEGGEHEVLEHRHVVGVDGGRVDGDRPELEAAGHRHLHDPATRLALDDRRLGVGPGGQQLLLHALRRGEEVVHVRGHRGPGYGPAQPSFWTTTSAPG